jgi:hypothetical protein
VLLPGAAPAQTSAPLAPAAQPPALEAAVILDRARAQVAARKIPPYIAYTQYAALARHGRTRAEQARIVLRTADGKVNSTPLPDSPNDRVDATPTVDDRPLVFPTTTFGFARRGPGEAPSQYESRSTPAAGPSGPAVIGHVTATARDYDATLVGSETLAGAGVYHLRLVPRFDPQHHPIREMWIDASTFDPRRIAIELWAQTGPVRSRPTVTVDFAPVDGTWLVSHAAMDFVLRFAFLNYGGSGDFRISDVSFPTSEPDWMFDRKGLAAHLHASPSS